MRRNELEVNREKDLRQLLAELSVLCNEGYLALVTAEGFPRCLAVNFALHNGAIVFHGALAGEKYDFFQTGGKVGFTLVQALSMLPSTWFAKDNACPATQLFRSIEIKGHCRLIEDAPEKAVALQALMEKYQPEGGFIPLNKDLAKYSKSLAGTGVFAIDEEGSSGKIKVMQENSSAMVAKTLKHLRERGLPVDLLTAELMERYRPAED